MKKYFFSILFCIVTLSAFNQNVGISDQLFTPQSPLHIYRTTDGNLFQAGRSTAVNSGFQIAVTGTSNFQLINRENGYLSFFTSNIERARISTTGLFGIGTAFPNSWLHVNGDGTTIPFRVQNAGNSRFTVGANGGVTIGTFNDNPPAGGLYVLGSTGIGVAAPTAQLHTTATVRFQNYSSGVNGALLTTDAAGNLAITNFTGNATDVLQGDNTFGPGSSLWQDQTTYIRPRTTTVATYPWIFDDNTTVINNGNATQFFINASGGNTQAGIYVYSSQNIDGTGWAYDQVRSNIKAYDYFGNNYNSAISGYSWLDNAGSSAILGGRYNGTPRSELATRSTTYDGSATSALYSLKLTGDFYNQDVNWGQSTYLTSATWSLRTVTCTTHGTGTDNSIVWIHAEVDYYLNTSWPTSGAYVVFGLFRNGTYISEISEYSEDEVDKTIHLQWLDNPTSGNHTYEIRVRYNTGTMYYYGHQLHVVELKR